MEIVWAVYVYLPGNGWVELWFTSTCGYWLLPMRCPPIAA